MSSVRYATVAALEANDRSCVLGRRGIAERRVVDESATDRPDKIERPGNDDRTGLGQCPVQRGDRIWFGDHDAGPGDPLAPDRTRSPARCELGCGEGARDVETRGDDGGTIEG